MRLELALASRAAVAAGEILMGTHPAQSSVRSDDGRDLKLAADVEAERIILQSLRQASPYPILSEEAGADADFDSSVRRWVVDPLDGTLNFGRGIPLSCVSIGLCEGMNPVLGVVYDFHRDRLFSGAIGVGAFCNGEPIKVSSVSVRSKAVLCTGFPVGRSFDESSLGGFVGKIRDYKKVRLLGSAALSLAWVAAGYADAYHEEGIKFWDVAAGLAIVTAAGGKFRSKAQEAPWQADVFASNGLLDVPV